MSRVCLDNQILAILAAGLIEVRELPPPPLVQDKLFEG